MTKVDQSSFGGIIREARIGNGWSQTELGERSGLSRPTIARVEADSDVTTATLSKIAEALGLTLELKGSSNGHATDSRKHADPGLVEEA
ncbi:helix-turn-helix transcriptional regulator [Herbiconiux sp. VKM Ac-1786]|uniref:helix-turn-helix domain-containing protein n=1 Tax=Herbiconiux sp. VKM Ac-1786 TaxID=2783824 RepID=UPI00188B041E|nr:helix-turn-helix transcriptional regulator [Herbiconiux sp. VKM Ac-1786]MBF4574504.1 helix-turn-helix transcriptional regulator [Herbiconiux sp. VKM Ac-1786]